MPVAPVLLDDLFARLPSEWAARWALPAGSQTVSITGIAEDSRRMESGAIFVAHRGRGTDGHRYVAAALSAGAVGVVGELAPDDLPVSLPENVFYWQAPDGREAFALLSAAFFDYPSRKLKIVGVTGTDGKTTTSTLTQRMLEQHGLRTGLITTIGASIGGEELPTGFHVTTPEAFDLQHYLAQIVEAGCEAAVVETTSHGLDQKRVAFIEYDVAAVTNVTHEHLDWHGTWENYMAAKALLFRALATSTPKPGIRKTAILNRDDKSYEKLKDLWAEQTFTYTLDTTDTAANATLSARDVVIDRAGTHFLLVAAAETVPVHLHLYGSYNVANALAAAGVGLAFGIPLHTIAAGLEATQGVRGRMEWVYGKRADDAFDVIVDFAHTPNALRETLQLAQTLKRPGGRVIAVFGSAGLRDVEKRDLMGRVARAADFSVLTAEDPRTEDVNEIIAAIAGGLTAQGGVEGRDFMRVPDRAEAIATALRLARENDLVVTCGKAHEQSMCYGTEETPWDEFAVIREALNRMQVERQAKAAHTPDAHDE